MSALKTLLMNFLLHVYFNFNTALNTNNEYLGIFFIIFTEDISKSL